MNKKIIITLLIVVLPLIAFAQTNSSASTGSYSPFKLLNGSISPQGSAWTFKLPYLGGSGSQLVCVDNSGLFSITGCPSGGGGGAAGVISTTTPLVNTQVVFSTGVASIGNDSAFTYNAVSDRLTVSYASTTAITASGNIQVPLITANSSAGVTVEANNGTDVGIFGAGNTANSTFYGGVNIDGATRLATSLTGLLKATAGVVSTGANGTDYTLVTGTTCTNQFMRALSSSGSITCATVANTDLANSTISGVSLGGTLANLTATDSTLTFSGTYTGATARTIGLNLGNANTWTARQTFNYSSSTIYSSFVTSSSTTGYFGTVFIPNLGTAAGSFLAVNASGQVIATTTPSGGGGGVSGSGTTNTISKFTGATSIGNSGLTDDGSLLSYAGGNFTVSNTGTLGAVSISAISTESETFSGSNSATGTFLYSTSTPFGIISINPTQFDAKHPLVIGSSTATSLIVRQGGNVGVGTSTPGSIFSIQGVANFVASAMSTIYNGLRILGTLVLPNLGTPAGAFLAVDPSGNVIATTTPSGGSSSPSIDTSYSHIIDEFAGNVDSYLYKDISTLSWETGNFTPYLQYGTSTNPGVMSFYPGYGVNNVGWLSLGNTTSASFTGSIGSKTNWELRFVFRTASVSTQSVYRVGLMDTTMNSQTPSNGIWLRYNNNSACTTTGSDATWIYENRNGGTSSTATGPSFGTDTWTHLRMRSTTTGVVGFSVSQNGGAFSTEQLISTNIPTSALVPTFQITNCASQYLYPQLDRFDWLQTNLTR